MQILDFFNLVLQHFTRLFQFKSGCHLQRNPQSRNGSGDFFLPKTVFSLIFSLWKCRFSPVAAGSLRRAHGSGDRRQSVGRSASGQAWCRTWAQRLQRSHACSGLNNKSEYISLKIVKNGKNSLKFLTKTIQTIKRRMCYNTSE